MGCSATWDLCMVMALDLAPFQACTTRRATSHSPLACGVMMKVFTLRCFCRQTLSWSRSRRTATLIADTMARWPAGRCEELTSDIATCTRLDRTVVHNASLL